MRSTNGGHRGCPGLNSTVLYDHGQSWAPQKRGFCCLPHATYFPPRCQRAPILHHRCSFTFRFCFPRATSSCYSVIAELQHGPHGYRKSHSRKPRARSSSGPPDLSRPEQGRRECWRKYRMRQGYWSRAREVYIRSVAKPKAMCESGVGRIPPNELDLGGFS